MTFTTAPSGMPTRLALSARHSSRPTRTRPTRRAGPDGAGHDRILVRSSGGRRHRRPALPGRAGGAMGPRRRTRRRTPRRTATTAARSRRRGRRSHRRRRRRSANGSMKNDPASPSRRGGTRHRRPSRSSASCRDRSPPGGYRCGAAESATIVVSNRPARTDRCRVHGDTEVRADLEVQMRNADRVPGVADVADDLRLFDPAGGRPRTPRGGRSSSGCRCRRSATA